MQSIMSSTTITRDITPGFKNHPDFLKPSRDFMPSDHSSAPAPAPALASYRSAPSTFLGALLDLESAGDNNSSSGDDESDAFFSAILDPRDLNHHHHHKTPNGYNNNQMHNQQQYSSSIKEEVQNGSNGGAVVGSYSLGMETTVSALQGNNAHRNSSNLTRQSSSPAGFFNGFGVMGDVGSYRVHNEATSSHVNFSPAPSSSTNRFMPSIPENVTGNGNTAAPGCPHDSWKELQFNNSKRNRDDETNMFSNFNDLESQNQETRKNGLMQKNAGKMPVVEKYLHFQPETTTPCQMRAKRGFATHPRSIAERMRRTRISEKMKKLQDLFPNMDKQTNTADMLDLAVEYIKDLQKQVQTLTDTKARCVCLNKPQ